MYLHYTTERNALQIFISQYWEVSDIFFRKSRPTFTRTARCYYFILFLFGEQCFDFFTKGFEEVADCRKAFLQ